MRKICKTSGKEFKITPNDLRFYEKLGVPEPTLSPEERLKRRMSWRNDRVFYKRTCSFSGKKIISMYDKETPFPVYHQDYWWSDKWNPKDFGRSFNFDTPFFEQWENLMLEVPRLGMDIVNCKNSDYCNYCGDDKDCYIDIAGEANENCYFNLFTKHSLYAVDCTFSYNSEWMYESISCYKCYNIKYSILLEDCRDCLFSYDLKGCSDCFLSSNLRNKKYYIANKPYSKEEYFERIHSLELDSYALIQKLKKQWKEIIGKGIHKYIQINNSENCMGDNLSNCKNILYGFNVSGSEDSSFLYDVLDAKNCRDLNYSLYEPEMSLELISTLAMKGSAFSMASHYCRNTFYSDQCNNSSNLFGCIGLNNSEYCILNKQYTKEEYNKLIPKVIEYMKTTSEWGEFFPSSLSPWGYNETVANEYYPLSKDDALKRGYTWKDEKEKTKYMGNKTNIKDSIHDIDDSVLERILDCNTCEKNYRIVGPELQFYRKVKLPLPRECPSCRHLARMKLRNPRKLYERSCSKCSISIQTSYAPEKTEIIYCGTCYDKEVY